jgi:hypothetical protein
MIFLPARARRASSTFTRAYRGGDILSEAGERPGMPHFLILLSESVHGTHTASFAFRLHTISMSELGGKFGDRHWISVMLWGCKKPMVALRIYLN